MRTGTIHSVFTSVGGYLAGINSSTIEDVSLSSKIIRLQLDKNQEQDQIIEDIDWYERTLESTLNQANYAMIPTALYSLNQLLCECDSFPGRQQDKVWKRIHECKGNIWSLWKKRFVKRSMKGTEECKCICGVSFNDFRKHYTPEQCRKVGQRLEGQEL
jgi:hypothetical protein